jgi:hypothetical protein
MWEWRYGAIILDLNIRRRLLVSFTLLLLYLREKATAIQWIEGWVGHRAGLDVTEERKISCPCWDLNLTCACTCARAHTKFFQSL